VNVCECDLDVNVCDCDVHLVEMMCARLD